AAAWGSGRARGSGGARTVRSAPQSCGAQSRGGPSYMARALLLDMRFHDVGRIALASGAYTKGELRKRKDLLTRLAGKGRLDLLRAIQAGTLSITHVYDA